MPLPYSGSTTLATFKSDFDALWTSAGETWATTRATSGGKFQEHYHLYYPFAGKLAMWQAYGDVNDLNDMITLINHVIDDAVPVVWNSSYLGWPADISYGAGYADNGVALWESYLWRAVATMLRVMYQSPNLLATAHGQVGFTGTTYQNVFDSLLAFIQQHIWNKWIAFSSSIWVYRENAHMSSHWARIGMELYIITGQSQYKQVFDNISFAGLPGYPTGSSLEGVKSVVSGSVQWSSTWPPDYDIQDSSHGADIISFWNLAYENKMYWGLAHMQGLANTLSTKVFPSSIGDNITVLIDGTGGNDTGKRMKDWSFLGLYDETLRGRINSQYITSAVTSDGGNGTQMLGIAGYTRAVTQESGLVYPEQNMGLYNGPWRQFRVGALTDTNLVRNNHVKLAWENVAGATGYQIQYKFVPDTDGYYDVESALTGFTLAVPNCIDNNPAGGASIPSVCITGNTATLYGIPTGRGFVCIRAINATNTAFNNWSYQLPVRTGLFPNEKLYDDNAITLLSEPTAGSTAWRVNAVGVHERRVSVRTRDGNRIELAIPYPKVNRTYQTTDGGGFVRARSGGVLFRYDLNTYLPISHPSGYVTEYPYMHLQDPADPIRMFRAGSGSSTERSKFYRVENGSSTLLYDANPRDGWNDASSITRSGEEKRSWDQKKISFEEYNAGDYRNAYVTIFNLETNTLETTINTGWDIGEGQATICPKGRFVTVKTNWTAGTEGGHLFVWNVETPGSPVFVGDYAPSPGAMSPTMDHSDFGISIQGNSCIAGRSGGRFVMIPLEGPKAGQVIDLIPEISRGSEMGHGSAQLYYHQGWFIWENHAHGISAPSGTDPFYNFMNKIFMIQLDESAEDRGKNAVVRQYGQMNTVGTLNGSSYELNVYPSATRQGDRVFCNIYQPTNGTTNHAEMWVLQQQDLHGDEIPLTESTAMITGELKKWHKINFEFTSTASYNETTGTNPFRDLRLNVTFTGPSAQIYVVPGFFAADGNAAETSASSGNKWHCNFTPDEAGTWSYSVSFRTGTDIAIEYPANSTTGSALDFNGESDTFVVAASDKTGTDNRAKGRLVYDGTRYLKYSETGEYFIKAGPDSPETTLAYDDFDNTSTANTVVKTWTPHLADWQTGDPEWQGTKGREIIGMVNYLAAQGMNSFSFLTMNVIGDGKNVWPWAATTHAEVDGTTNPDATNRTYYDVSKLAQWEILFDHADKKGMFLHFKTQETENDQLLDGGALDVQRKLYYRELIARFGHHLALNWNLSEETSQSDAENIAQIEYIKDIDPYGHLRVIHTFPEEHDLKYDPLLGSLSELTGASMQISPQTAVHTAILKWVNDSATAGKQWVVSNDEQGPANEGVAVDSGYSGNQGSGTVADNRDLIRKEVLWGTLMAGGAGVEYYYGFQTGTTDLNAQDHRSRATKWADAKKALDFFKTFDFKSMVSDDSIVTGSSNWAMKNPGNQYLVYLKNGGTTNITTTGVSNYNVRWFDPRNGGALQVGSISQITTGTQSIGNPPNSTTSDWAALITKQQSTGSIIYVDEIYGFNTSDSGAIIRNAINSNNGTGNTLIFRNMGQPWYTETQLEVSNINNLILIFESGCVIEAKQGFFGVSGGTNKLWRFNTATDLTIIGYGAKFRMYKSDNPGVLGTNTLEFGHNIQITDALRVKIYGLELQESCGDGIYVARWTDCLIEDCYIHDHKRQGISVIKCNGLTIRHCKIDNTSGTNPQCGIDVEPNNSTGPTDHIENLIIEHCSFDSNNHEAIGFLCSNMVGTQPPISATVRDCYANNNGIDHINGQFNTYTPPAVSTIDDESRGASLYFAFNEDSPQLDGTINIQRWACDSNYKGAVYLAKDRTIQLNFEDCVFRNPWTSGAVNERPWETHGSSTFDNAIAGGIFFNGVLTRHNNNNEWFVVSIGDTAAGFADVTGNVTTIAQNGDPGIGYDRTYVGQNNSNITVTEDFNTSVPTTTVNVSTLVNQAIKTTGQNGVFRFTRSSSKIDYPMYVKYSYNAPTVPQGNSIHRLTGAVVIPEGQTFADVNIIPRNNGLTEANRNIQLTIEARSNLYTVGSNSSATLQIVDTGSGSGDTTPPVILSYEVFNITQTSFTVDWTLNEGSQGRIEWGLTTSYGNTTALESNYLLHHIQTVSGLTAGTTYHWRILGADAAGNQLVGPDRTTVTTSVPVDPIVGTINIKRSKLGTSLGKKNFLGTNLIFSGIVGGETEEPTPPPSVPEVQLNTLKAFPTAFGHASTITGGRGGQLLFVTSLSDSGAGSLRTALTTSGTRTIVIKVAGRISLNSQITVSSGNVTIVGQTAPGQGLTVSGNTIQFSAVGNVIMRHITARFGPGGSPSVNDVIRAVNIPANTGFYIDHVSAGWGFDEILSLDQVSGSTQVSTVANCLFAEGFDNGPEGPDAHNTGHIIGAGTGTPSTELVGKHTYARNMTYNISHRFPNHSGTGGNLEAYNNILANWSSRLTRVTGDPLVDWFNNYAYAGNKSKAGGANAINRFGHSTCGLVGGGDGFRTYTAGNIVQGYNTNPSSNQENLWSHFYDSGCIGVVEGDPVASSFFVGSRQGNGENPYNGVWTAQETFDNLMDEVGHTRATDSNGNPVSVRDSLDTSYINKVQTNTTESSYRSSTLWVFPTITTGTPFTDSNNNGIADSFEATHGLTGDGTQVKVNWDFGTFTLVNNAGYNNREIYWAWLAGDLDKLAGVSSPGGGGGGSTNLYTLLNSANPENETNATTNTDNQNEFTISSVSSSPTPQHGSFCLTFTRTAGDVNPEDCFINLGSILTTGVTYQITLYAQQVIGTANWTLELNSGFGWVSTDLVTVTNTGSWVQYTLQATAATSPKLRINSPGGTATGNKIAIDNIRIVQV